MAQRVGFWQRTSTSAKLAIAAVGVTVVYGVVAGLGFSLTTGSAGWSFALFQMTAPLLVIEVLVVLALRNRKSNLHNLGVIGSALVGLGASGQGVLQTVVVIAQMVGGTVPKSGAPMVLVAAVLLAVVGALFIVTAVVGWRETQKETRSSPRSTLGTA